MKQTLSRLTVVSLLALSAVLICIACACSGGCGANPPKPIADVVDCTKQDAAQIAAAGAQCACKTPVLAATQPACAGQPAPTWADAEACIVGELPAIGWQIGGCVLADLAQQYLSKPEAARDVQGSHAARGALEDYRAKYAHDSTFHTAAGDL